ncbi:MAG: alkaline phosphatase family protein [Caulobacter sp.]|nr:alkaline phosphatase family protein [Caulobacter sp.]
MRVLVRVMLAVLALLATMSSPAFARERTPLILVSIDGLRAEYLKRGLTPTLTAFSTEGARATGMRPSFPVNTFPNHYTVVTGLTPDHHGITDNTLFDPARPGVKFSMGAREQVEDRFWWDGGEPIWVTAERQGVKAATMFWPGSEAPVRGVRPSIWSVYDKTMPAPDRVDRLLGWFDLPAAERPVLMTLYFEAVDTAGHGSGPRGAEVEQALRDVDAALARLVEGLKARGLYDKVNIIVVSDHGMEETAADRWIFLEEVFGPGSFESVTLGSMAGLKPTSPEAEARIVGSHDHFDCWRKGEMPARYGYGTNPRIPPVMCLAKGGWTLTTREASKNWKPKTGGAHGYDPDDVAMQAIFVARGPAFREGVVLPRFRNVSVYPLMARLLAVEPAPNDGTLADTAAALK